MTKNTKSLSLFGLVSTAAAGLLIAFLLLPLLALGLTLPLKDLVAGLRSPMVLPALRLSMQTTLLSLFLLLAMGTPLAWLLSQKQSRRARLLETMVTLPAVLPPAVAGLALLLAFGRQGLFASQLSQLGLQIPFTTAAVVLAELFVSAPFFLQAALQAFRGLDEEQLLVARSLGAGPGRLFFRVALPLAAPALVAGALIAWARALGEFGATLLFAGNLAGETQTLSLAVYTAFESDLRAAQSIALVLMLLALTVMLSVGWLGKGRRSNKEKHAPQG